MAAAWDTTIGEFLLPYAAVQSSADPRAEILEFLRSTYDVGAKLLGWPDELIRFDVPEHALANAHSLVAGERAASE